MAVITYREAVGRALREALQDERVFMMGEDIGRYGGAYAVSRGLLDEFGPERIRETPISESVITGAGAGAAMAGLRPIVELMTINFSLAGHGPDNQPRRQGEVHVRRSTLVSTDRAHGHRRWRLRGSHALAEPGRLVRRRARPSRCRPVHSPRRAGPLPSRNAAGGPRDFPWSTRCSTAAAARWRTSTT